MISVFSWSKVDLAPRFKRTTTSIASHTYISSCYACPTSLFLLILPPNSSSLFPSPFSNWFLFLVSFLFLYFHAPRSMFQGKGLQFVERLRAGREWDQFVPFFQTSRTLFLPIFWPSQPNKTTCIVSRIREGETKQRGNKGVKMYYWYYFRTELTGQ